MSKFYDVMMLTFYIFKLANYQIDFIPFLNSLQDLQWLLLWIENLLLPMQSIIAINTCNCKYTPANIYFIGKILQPCIH